MHRTYGCYKYFYSGNYGFEYPDGWEISIEEV